MTNADVNADLEPSTTESIARLAREGLEPRNLQPDDGRRVASVLVPEGTRHELIDLERYDTHPERKRGQVNLHEHTSFADYLFDHALPGTHVYADVRNGTVTAVLNDHTRVQRGDSQPGWGDHRATLDLRHSHEWVCWTQRNGGLMSQDDFAEHLEDNYVDIVEPDHATMLEIAQSIQASSSAEFKSKQRLQDGQVALRYEEQVEARAGQKGDLTIPETFTVALRVYEGTLTTEMTARLRYRIRDGQLAIGYRLERLDDVRDAAFASVIDEIEQRAGHTCLRGKAPAPLTAG